MKTLLAPALGALAALVVAVAVPAWGQDNCRRGSADDRARAFCLNQPGTTLPSVRDATFARNGGASLERGERRTCGGREYGATLWVIVHPHANGRIDVAVGGLDAHLALESADGALLACSGGSDGDGARETLSVGGLRAGRAYYLQIGGYVQRIQRDGDRVYARGRFGFELSFTPEVTAGPSAPAPTPMPVEPVGTPAPDPSPAPTASPSATPSVTPTADPPADPDPDSDGVRGEADRCPGAGTQGRDLNQDGCRDKARQTVDVKWRIALTNGKGVVLRELRLRGAGAGTRVRVKCSKACDGTTIKPKRSRTRVSARRLGRTRVPPGTLIDVSVTRAGRHGEVHRFKVYKTTMDEIWTRCLPEGAKAPVRGRCY
jgi:hypothetical protein